MGFNKKYLPPLPDLKKRLEENPESVKLYWGADTLIGPPESVEYIHHLWEEHERKNVK